MKNSEKEKEFISDLIYVIRNINTLSIPDINSLELIVQEYTSALELIWYKHLKVVKITK